MNEIIYFDTSALAKWYLNEERSDDVEKYIQDQGPVAISDLTTVEMRCLLARRRREKNIDSKMEMQIWATFQEDIRQNSLICYPLPADLAAGAINPIGPLRFAASNPRCISLGDRKRNSIGYRGNSRPNYGGGRKSNGFLSCWIWQTWRQIRSDIFLF